jgi:predicted nucleic acid-binding protein
LESSSAVIDANIAIYALIATDQTQLALSLLERFQAQRIGLYAPGLWVSEVASGIHKYLHVKLITPEIAEDALSNIFELGVILMNETPAICKSASRWATRMNQMAVYDGYYLAVAEALNVPLWTADKRLANSAKQIGVSWVYWLGDLE